MKGIQYYNIYNIFVHFRYTFCERSSSSYILPSNELLFMYFRKMIGFWESTTQDGLFCGNSIKLS